ncbi:putative LRR receptor-like serine/threonine-protein kinase [Gossypium australe]|uniref:Putative LRR receptor-like serine/threonine-protein kinase n=1 Tax=Gossypium australe TaxID=47621 RepID=A0A5B6WJJ5_9ROSI|nr:putative LRR receptor-like serine/threonine-protein kinase [Gossypium australe]
MASPCSVYSRINSPVDHSPSAGQQADSLAAACAPTTYHQPTTSVRTTTFVNSHPMQTRSKSGIYKPKPFSSILTEKEPISIIEAFQSPAWTAAAQTEYRALLSNHTWDLMPLPAGQRAVRFNWIFKIKRNADDSVARCKDRLVMKGYFQEAGFEQQGNNGQQLVCKLRKALYCLKQAPWAWFHKMGEFLLANEFELLYVLVYVDNIIITGSASQAIDQFVNKLDEQFSLKDLGKLSYFLGVQVNYTHDGIFLSQRKYILDLLRKAPMNKSNGSLTPMVTTCRLSAHEGSPVENEQFFRSIVSALQYVVITRLDIAFSVNKVYQFIHRPLDLHFQAVKRILCYLQGTLDHGLRFSQAKVFLLEGYSDSSWGSNTDDRKSTSCYCVFLGGNPVSWSSRKQQVVFRSTAEAEYRSLTHVTTEIVWIRSLLTELCALVWCDSSAAVAVAGNPIMHSKFKHVELDLFFAREKAAAGAFQVGYVPSQNQIADILTKRYPKDYSINLEVSLELSLMNMKLQEEGNINQARGMLSVSH